MVVWVWCGSQDEEEEEEEEEEGAWKMWTAPWFGCNRHGGRRLMVPCFSCWAAAISLTVRVYPLLPSILPSVSPRLPPPSPDQLYQHDKNLRNTGVTSLLPALPCSPYPHLSKAFTFSFWCWESPTLCAHLEDAHTHTRAYTHSLSLNRISKLSLPPCHQSPDFTAAGWVCSATSLLVWKTSLWPVLSSIPLWSSPSSCSSDSV